MSSSGSTSTSRIVLRIEAPRGREVARRLFEKLREMGIEVDAKRVPCG